MGLEELSPKDREVLFEGLLNNSYHGITAFEAIRDDSGEIEDFLYIYANSKAETLLHKSSSELVGHRFLSVFPGVKEEGLFDRFIDVVESGESFNIDHDYYRDGLAASFQVSVSKFRDGMVVFFVETTEQIKLASRLSQLTERLEMATAGAKVGIWDYDMIADELIWDEVMHEIYGTKAEEFNGKYSFWQKSVHPDDLHLAEAALEQSIAEKKDFRAKFRIIRPSGNYRWIDTRARLKYDADGKPIRLIGTNWDITELTQAYDDLAVAKEQAEQANAAKSEFLAVMSHELRTPLNPILGFTELLRELLSDPEEIDIVETILKSGLSLEAIISDILDFCTLDKGKLVLHPRPEDPHACAHSICKEFSHMAKQKGLEVVLSKTADCPDSHILDSQRFQQIIRNLVSNAIKFTDTGRIEIKLSSREDANGDTLLIVKVSDTGMGIPENQLNYIFDRFTQLDASNTRKQGGSGLGLAICRRLSRLMGGDIYVESKLGKGTTFTLEIPSAEESMPIEAAPSVPSIQADACRNARVLLVDDDQANLFYLTKIMRGLGTQVLSESNPIRGKSLALEENFDVIFLDLHMPELSGMDIARDIRSTEGDNRNSPIIAVTADARPGIEESCLQQGFNRVITKPLDLTTLSEAIYEFTAV